MTAEMAGIYVALVTALGSLGLALFNWLANRNRASVDAGQVHAIAAKTSIETATELMGQLRTRVAELEAELGSAKQRIQTLEGERQTALDASTRRDIEIAHLQAQLAVMADSLIAVTDERDELRERVRTLEAEVAELRQAQGGKPACP